MSTPSPVSLVPFSNLIDVAACEFGTRVLDVSDEFFAEAKNLFEPGRGVFIDGKYTDRGKWMDGWESRRKRAAGYDWCIVQLGVTARLAGFDIDTHFFNGNHPAFASIDGALLPPGATAEQARAATWHELLPQVALQGDRQNIFAATQTAEVNALRLNIFPDGGVARLRAYGRIVPAWNTSALDNDTAARLPTGAVDLAAVLNGGHPLMCSDARFSPMHHVLLPGRASDMGGGWETRRRRGPGYDWLIIELGARGTAGLIEIDTAHFKGNYPESFSVDVIDVTSNASSSVRTTELIASEAWRCIIPRTPLQADTRHFFEGLPEVPATHLRLNIFPDGGVSRLRVWGQRLDVQTPRGQS